MNFREAFQEINGMGKVGVLAMADGALALTAALGLESTTDVEIYGHLLPETSTELNVAVGLGGTAINIAGLHLFTAGYRRSSTDSVDQ